MTRTSILELTRNDLDTWLINQDELPYRSSQILNGLYKNFFIEFNDFSNLPIHLRTKLTETFCILPLNPVEKLVSKNKQTEKFLFELNDKTKIESVLMKYEDRNTVCVSTQVGCPIGCSFCATGQMGFTRNLIKSEIIGQVLYFNQSLKFNDKHVTNVVLMGMGEPLLNYENTLNAIHAMNNETLLNLGARNITISSVGIPQKIVELSKEKIQINLAVSLHAANNDLRSTLVPISKKYPISEVIESVKTYISETNRRVTFEYALINNLNDSLEHAQALVNLLKGMLSHVNLIPLNPTGRNELRGSPPQKVANFEKYLLKNHIPTSIRKRRGIEINAGCGQLAYRNSP